MLVANTRTQATAVVVIFAAAAAAAADGVVASVSPFCNNEDGENAAGSGDVFSQVLESSSENLLADDSDRLAEVLVACGERGGERVDIVVDNAGNVAEATDITASPLLSLRVPAGRRLATTHPSVARGHFLRHANDQRGSSFDIPGADRGKHTFVKVSFAVLPAKHVASYAPPPPLPLPGQDSSCSAISAWPTAWPRAAPRAEW